MCISTGQDPSPLTKNEKCQTNIYKTLASDMIKKNSGFEIVHQPVNYLHRDT